MPETFTVRDEHGLLLHGMYVRWDDTEFGAPCIDPKRPYGNSNVLDDMREILGEGWSDEDLGALHRETQTVLQILLTTGGLDTVEYVREQFGKWRKATDA